MRTATETKISQKYHHTEYINGSHHFSPLFNKNCDELTLYGLPVATLSTDRTKGLQTILLNVTKDHTKTEDKQEKHDIRYDIIGRLNFACPVLYIVILH